MTNLEQLLQGFSPEDSAKIQSVHALACKELEGRFRGRQTADETTLKPFIEHPENVALIVKNEIGLGAECIQAVFLHETLRFNPTLKVTEHDYGHDVLEIAKNLCKISQINPRDTRLEAENYKKLIASYSMDPRVILLKIADRLEVMRNLNLFTKGGAEKKVLETYFLYIPLAHQLGLYNFKSELEDICFKVSNPAEHRYINTKLREGVKEREKLMSQFIEPLKVSLDNLGIHYKLKMRTKTAYSIFRKMQKQKVDYNGVYDVFAIRLILDCPGATREQEVAECWKVFSLVTEKYEQDTKRLRDWLTNPKSNGYESLHITIHNEAGTPLEVQIRTSRMDAIAESGLASHWSYKGIKQENVLNGWLSSVRARLENKSAETTTDEDLGADISLKEIFVYTPTGELRRLAAGATVLDFAFEIHTNVGCTCTGGRINGKAVSIDTLLKTGDTVEILTSKTQKPRESWLNIVVSSKAKTKIRQCLAKEEFDKAQEGRELLERRLKNWKLTLRDETIQEILKYKQVKTLNEFYTLIAQGQIDVADIKVWITDGVPRIGEEQEKQRTRWDEHKAASASKGDILFKGANIKGLDYKMAQCCNPVYGDEIIGFVTRLEGIKIHRTSCPNAIRMKEAYPYRVIDIEWNSNPASSSFISLLNITTKLEESAINEVMTEISRFKATMRSFSFNENAHDKTYDIQTRVALASVLEIDKILSALRKLRCVIKANRSL
ncbi:MAG: bifunctional (p)ppGpp synthetase/guanosine-3',5'-bis(diphosphate) 3'-pyrophosphohydrolase [Bacteroidales bacterium]|nr:bifunctional (p)ppGpp synthetase/guanosine-3',5'-bis(diphosphate) 3'-pyrophosphohydrolase [Bacteroidales bacterium]